MFGFGIGPNKYIFDPLNIKKLSSTIPSHLFIATKYEWKPETIDKWNRWWCLYTFIFVKRAVSKKCYQIYAEAHGTSAYKEKAMVIIPDKTIHPSHILWFMGCAIGLYK